MNMGKRFHIAFGIILFYQSADGQIGMSGQLENVEGFYMASYIAGVIIMFCGLVLIALVKPWSRVVPDWLPLIGSKKINRLIIIIPPPSLHCFFNRPRNQRNHHKSSSFGRVHYN